MIPKELSQAIFDLIADFSQEELAKSSKELTHFYRERDKGALMPLKSYRDKCAYLAARLPATFASVAAALESVREQYLDPINSLLDLGSGPGTALFACSKIFGSLAKATLVERDAEMIEIGKKLSISLSIPAASWVKEDLKEFEPEKPFDMVIASYSLGELPDEERKNLLQRILPFVQGVLLIIEPGTPQGFSCIRTVREHLIALGAHVIAPCPHNHPCPMPHNDWCHFSVRLERSFWHRRVKEASLGYEDEKFSYVAVTKKAASPAPARILRHPEKHSGHLSLTLCTLSGLKKETISRKMGELYKKAKKLKWGDPFDEEG